MKTLPIFHNGVKANDPAYVNLRGAKEGLGKQARDLTEKLWRSFQSYADEHFLIEIRNSFDERFWEMYLVCTLLEKGFCLKHRD